VSAVGSADRRFRELYDQYGAHIYAYFRRRTDAPRDCTADTFLVAWRRIDDVPDGEAALRWLYGVSKRVLLNHRRSRRRLHRLTARLVGTATASIDGPERIVRLQPPPAAAQLAAERVDRDEGRTALPQPRRLGSLPERLPAQPLRERSPRTPQQRRPVRVRQGHAPILSCALTES